MMQLGTGLRSTLNPPQVEFYAVRPPLDLLNGTLDGDDTYKARPTRPAVSSYSHPSCRVMTLLAARRRVCRCCTC